MLSPATEGQVVFLQVLWFLPPLINDWLEISEIIGKTIKKKKKKSVLLHELLSCIISSFQHLSVFNVNN